MANDDFQQLAVVHDPDGSGAIAIVTVRDRASGFRSYSFALFKEFEHDGVVKKSSYLMERHLDVAHRLIDMVAEVIKADQEKLNTAKRRAR